MLSVPTSAMSSNKLSSLFSLLEYSLGTKTENEDAEEFSAYSLNTTPKTFKVSPLFVEIYQNFNVIEQTEKMKYYNSVHSLCDNWFF